MRLVHYSGNKSSLDTMDTSVLIVERLSKTTRNTRNSERKCFMRSVLRMCSGRRWCDGYCTHCDEPVHEEELVKVKSWVSSRLFRV